MTNKELIKEIDRRIYNLENNMPEERHKTLKSAYVGAASSLNDLKKWIEENEE